MQASAAGEEAPAAGEEAPANDALELVSKIMIPANGFKSDEGRTAAFDQVAEWLDTTCLTSPSNNGVTCDVYWYITKAAVSAGSPIPRSKGKLTAGHGNAGPHNGNHAAIVFARSDEDEPALRLELWHGGSIGTAAMISVRPEKRSTIETRPTYVQVAKRITFPAHFFKTVEKRIKDWKYRALVRNCQHFLREFLECDLGVRVPSEGREMLEWSDNTDSTLAIAGITVASGGGIAIGATVGMVGGPAGVVLGACIGALIFGIGSAVVVNLHHKDSMASRDAAFAEEMAKLGIFPSI